MDFEINGLQVKVERKPIKHIYLRVKPVKPARQAQDEYYVLVTAPRKSPEKQLRALVETRFVWLENQIERQKNLSRPEAYKFEDGEEHLFLGQAYKLRIVPVRGAGHVQLTEELELHVPLQSNSQYRKNLLLRWYKNEFTQVVAPMFVSWQTKMGVRAKEWRMRKMKSRWGSCNTIVRRIWLNLELIKKPLPCIEYVLVHELAHLIERGHNPVFWGVMDRYMPDWKEWRKELNSNPPQA